MAVRKPCGLKKPVIQNTFGRSLMSQALNCEFRSSNSVYQKPNVADSHDIYNNNHSQVKSCLFGNSSHLLTRIHLSGILASYIESNDSRRL